MAGHDTGTVPYHSEMMSRIKQPSELRFWLLSGDSVPASRINMRKIKDVLSLKLNAQLTHRQIAAALGMSKAAVTKYQGLTAAAGLDWEFVWALTRRHWSGPARGAGAATRPCAA